MDNSFYNPVELFAFDIADLDNMIQQLKIKPRDLSSGR